MPTATSTDVLAYWFGPDVDGGSWQAEAEKWFMGGPAVDAEITARFATTLNAAVEDQLDDWAASAEGRLALIIVLDQFSRNVYRGMGQAFAADPKTLQLTMAGIELGHDAALHPVQRLFYYMPLMHAEAMWSQDLCMDKLQLLYDAAIKEEADYRELFAKSLEAGEKHRQIIARFGRYPHRNQVLDRTSTPEEQAFLAAGGPAFGQEAKSDP